MLFPTLTSLSNVLPHIADARAFYVIERDGYKAVDYGIMADDVFTDTVRLECRGLKFTPDGKIAARPFHKFFNMYEMERPEDIDWTQPYTVQAKLDGSMVHPCPLGCETVLMTRSGPSAQAQDAQSHAPDGFMDMCATLLSEGITPIFEFTSPDNRIVLAYETPQLTLLAARETVSGRYVPWDDLAVLAERLGVPRVEAVPIDFGTTPAFFEGKLAEVRKMDGIEGFVIAFDNGHRIKIKTDGYALRHKALSSLGSEANVLEWVIEGVVDDVLPLLSEEKADALRDYQAQVLQGLERLSGQVEAFHAQNSALDRRDYAREVKTTLPWMVQSAAFKRLEGIPTHKSILGSLKGRKRTRADVEKLRPLIDMSWPYAKVQN